MDAKIKRLLLALMVTSQLAFTCEGTETGNPQQATYSNDEYEVTFEYDSEWTVAELDAAGDVSGGLGPSSSPDPGIDTSDAPSVALDDGFSLISLFFVTLNVEPQSLLDYLETVFPSRDFTPFSNDFITGFTYDHADSGETGGDAQEYYFLREKTLLYLEAELFEENDGFAKFEIFIQSLRFE